MRQEEEPLTEDVRFGLTDERPQGRRHLKEHEGDLSSASTIPKGPLPTGAPPPRSAGAGGVGGLVMLSNVG